MADKPSEKKSDANTDKDDEDDDGGSVEVVAAKKARAPRARKQRLTNAAPPPVGPPPAAAPSAPSAMDIAVARQDLREIEAYKLKRDAIATSRTFQESLAIAPPATVPAAAVTDLVWARENEKRKFDAAFPSALPTMARRFERLRATILADDPTPVVFIRRSHPLHHHLERGAAALADEVADAREFARFLEGANPAKSSRGGLRVELLLACDLCHPKVDPAEAAAGLSNLRVHNLTRCASASFADGHPTKTYADAMAAALVAMGCAPVATAAPKNSAGDHPFALEEA